MVVIWYWFSRDIKIFQLSPKDEAEIWCPPLRSLKRVMSSKYKEFSRVSFWTLVLMLWGSGHFDDHVQRRVMSRICQDYLAWSAHYRCCVLYHWLTFMRAWFRSTRERQLTLNWNCLAGLAINKCGGAITHLHTWWQHWNYLQYIWVYSLNHL